MSEQDYFLLKFTEQKIKLLIPAEQVYIARILDNLTAINALNNKNIDFYHDLLNATSDTVKILTSQQQELKKRIGCNVIGAPFTNHDAELYALDKQLHFELRLFD